MKFCLNDLYYSFSHALDCVEHDLLGVTTYHGQRVAYICSQMGKEMGMHNGELLDLAGAAILHDNALTEYIHEELDNGINVLIDKDRISEGVHCVIGEGNIKNMPFRHDMSGAILYHHENADGSGPFAKKEEETPLTAQIIHIADQIDAYYDFSYMSESKYNLLSKFAVNNIGILFSKKCVDIFLKSCPLEKLMMLQRGKVQAMLTQALPEVEREFTRSEILGISKVFAGIVDYKSEFTRTHSIGIAEYADRMGRYYGYCDEECTKLYFAGALHDIGKLIVDRDILEKPDKLTVREYEHIQSHAYYTYEMLSQIKGLEDVTRWASFHHEKLNGRGYPFNKKSEELGKNERLIACLDIYHALIESRPYKSGLSHDKSIAILRSMGDKGMLDKDIIEDIDKCFGEEND